MLITEEPQLIRVVPAIISQVTLLLFADAGLDNKVICDNNIYLMALGNFSFFHDRQSWLITM